MQWLCHLSELQSSACSYSSSMYVYSYTRMHFHIHPTHPVIFAIRMLYVLEQTYFNVNAAVVICYQVPVIIVPIAI